MVEATNLYVGQLFSSYCQFITFLKAYENEHFVCFSKADSKSIEKMNYKPRKPIKPELKYYRVKFLCVRGGKYLCKGRGERYTSTLKIGCPAHICLCCTQNGKHLEIRRLVEDHNHEVSKETFKKLPQQRRLPPEIRKNAKEMLDMKVNKRMLQQKLQRDTGKIVTIRDLHNLAQRKRLILPKPEEIILEQGYKDVAETYNNEADVSIGHGYQAEETVTSEPVSEENDDKMDFTQNKANKAVEDLVREKKRSNDLKERLLEESKKQNTYLEALLKSNDVKEQLIEESRRRNKYLEAIIKLECINFNKNLKETTQEQA